LNSKNKTQRDVLDLKKNERKVGSCCENENEYVGDLKNGELLNG